MAREMSTPVCDACRTQLPAEGYAMCPLCLRQAALALEMGYSKPTVAAMLLSGEIDIIVGIPGGRVPRGYLAAPIAPPRGGAADGTRRGS